MFSEKSRLTDKRDKPFYGSYKENSAPEEIHWQNKKKNHHLAKVATVIVVLTVLSIGIILAITFPLFLDNQSRNLDHPDVVGLPEPSDSVLGIYDTAGVSSEEATCSQIGTDILKSRNGTAVDAAIAVALCLGVVSPQSSGLGGGIFMTIYSGGQMYALNARETAPLNVDPAVYDTDPSASRKGGLSVGVPSELAGLWAAHQRFGSVQWADLVSPARQLAADGFIVSKQLAKALQENKKTITTDANLASEFINPATNDVWVEGETLIRQKLAATLNEVQQGASSFYNGTLANKIIQDLNIHGGIITLEDLSKYSVEWANPITYQFSNNLTLFSLPFPSSGPIVALTLGILDGFGSVDSSNLTIKENVLDVHRLAEALKFAHAHRSQVSDPNFDDLATILDKTLSADYANDLRSKIADYKTYDDPEHYGAVYSGTQESGTAHTSIIGPKGDAVSLTLTINQAFGAGFSGNQTGIIFNNEMNDFSFPNKTGSYGLQPNPANFVEPGKRPASSMAPLIFLNTRNQPVFTVGGAGGGRIVSAIVTTSWRALYRKMDIKRATDYPRFAPQFEPPELQYEYGLPASFVEELRRRGHRPRRINTTDDYLGYLGSVNSVCRTRTTSKILTNADFRKHGASDGF